MRLFRALLWLYPAVHRREYGQEMLDAVEYRLGFRSGGTGRVVVAFDLAWGAVGVWRDRLGRWMMGAVAGWGLDVRFVARSLWRSRGYVTTAVVVLACAVAVNATVFSYVRGTLLSEPPYPDSDQVMVVWGSNVAEGQLRDVISGPNFIDLQQSVGALTHVAAFHSDGAYLLGDGRPEVLEALEVTVDFDEVLQVTPALGRFFDESDRMSGAACTVVLSHAFWRDRLDADPDVIGTALDFEGNPRTVIGVMPEGFQFITPVSLYIPIRDDILAADDRGHIHYHVIGRLAGQASVADANRDAATIMAGIVSEYPSYEGWSFLVEPLHRVSVEAVRPVIVILAVTVGLVLLVALVNLATLFRIRAHARSTELAVRSAIGADRVALLRVLTLETAWIAGTGAVLGLASAPFLLDYVRGMLPVWIAIPDSAARVPVLLGVLDPGVAMVAFASALFGSLLLTAPSYASAVRGVDAPRAGGGRVHKGIRGTRLLVGVEVAVATVLCIGAGLTVRSAANLLSVDVGLEAEGLLTLRFGDVWGLSPEDQVEYFRQVVGEVERIPGVRRAGVTDYVDFLAEDDYARIYFLDRERRPRADLREEWRRVDEGLFEAAGMSIIAGRGFVSSDFEGAPRSAVVNRAFAEKHYPGGAAVGELISAGTDSKYQEIEIVGIVEDLRSLGPAAPPPPMLYVTNQGEPRGTQGLYVRVAGDPMGFAEPVRAAVWSVDSSQPIDSLEPMSELVDSWVAIPRATRSLVLGLAILALVLSAVGVFGVVSYAVRTRRSEMGIRLALGASPARLESDQLRAIAPVLVMGLGAGLAVGLLAARGARSILYEVGPADPVSMAFALVGMTSAVVLATYLPARRAGRVDPTEVIRSE